MIMIDEYNKMGETGVNSSTEIALFEFYSELFASRHIHRVTCSPRTIIDNNATIILTVIGKNTEAKTTRLRLQYRNNEDRNIKTLGYIDINVAETIQQDFYRRYVEKKRKRQDLLDKHGVRGIKELEFAILTLQTYNDLSDIAKIKKIEPDLILSIIDENRRKNKMHYSLPTLTFLIMQVKGMLALQTEINNLS